MRLWFLLLGVLLNFIVGSYKFCCDLRDDGISKGAQSSHSVGNPISQQWKVGFISCSRPPVTFIAYSTGPGILPNALVLLRCRPVASGVPTHKPNSLSMVRSGGGTSRQTRRRAGVTNIFHVEHDFIQPSSGNRINNLFTKDNCR